MKKFVLFFICFVFLLGQLCGYKQNSPSFYLAPHSQTQSLNWNSQETFFRFIKELKYPSSLHKALKQLFLQLERSSNSDPVLIYKMVKVASSSYLADWEASEIKIETLKTLSILAQMYQQDSLQIYSVSEIEKILKGSTGDVKPLIENLIEDQTFVQNLHPAEFKRILHLSLKLLDSLSDDHQKIQLIVKCTLGLIGINEYEKSSYERIKAYSDLRKIKLIEPLLQKEEIDAALDLIDSMSFAAYQAEATGMVASYLIVNRHPGGKEKLRKALELAKKVIYSPKEFRSYSNLLRSIADSFSKRGEVEYSTDLISLIKDSKEKVLALAEFSKAFYENKNEDEAKEFLKSALFEIKKITNVKDKITLLLEVAKKIVFFDSLITKQSGEILLNQIEKLSDLLPKNQQGEVLKEVLDCYIELEEFDLAEQVIQKIYTINVQSNILLQMTNLVEKLIQTGQYEKILLFYKYWNWDCYSVKPESMLEVALKLILLGKKKEGEELLNWAEKVEDQYILIMQEYEPNLGRSYYYQLKSNLLLYLKRYDEAFLVMREIKSKLYLAKALLSMAIHFRQNNEEGCLSRLFSYVSIIELLESSDSSDLLLFQMASVLKKMTENVREFLKRGAYLTEPLSKEIDQILGDIEQFREENIDLECNPLNRQLMGISLTEIQMAREIILSLQQPEKAKTPIQIPFQESLLISTAI